MQLYPSSTSVRSTCSCKSMSNVYCVGHICCALFTMEWTLATLLVFSVSFTKVEEKQHIVSKMQRYRLIREYNFRPMLPAPLCVFAYLKYVSRLWTLCKNYCFTDDDFDETMGFNQLESSKIIFSKIWQTLVTEHQKNHLPRINLCLHGEACAVYFTNLNTIYWRKCDFVTRTSVIGD